MCQNQPRKSLSAGNSSISLLQISVTKSIFAIDNPESVRFFHKKVSFFSFGKRLLIKSFIQISWYGYAIYVIMKPRGIIIATKLHCQTVCDHSEVLTQPHRHRLMGWVHFILIYPVHLTRCNQMANVVLIEIWRYGPLEWCSSRYESEDRCKPGILRNPSPPWMRRPSSRRKLQSPFQLLLHKDADPFANLAIYFQRIAKNVQDYEDSETGEVIES